MQKLGEVSHFIQFCSSSKFTFCGSSIIRLNRLFNFLIVLQISVVGDPVLNVNCCHIQTFDSDLYRQLICYPQVWIVWFYATLIILIMQKLVWTKSKIQINGWNWAGIFAMVYLCKQELWSVKMKGQTKWLNRKWDR